MITGSILDWQISASSVYPSEWDRTCHERYARIYQPHSFGWCARYKTASEWLQIDLGVLAKVRWTRNLFLLIYYEVFSLIRTPGRQSWRLGVATQIRGRGVAEGLGRVVKILLYLISCTGSMFESGDF